MCGIAGELSFAGGVVNAADIRRMTDALVHRGPDDDGSHCDGVIGLGHRRLSIIDLSPRGKQPMWTADGTMCIVFNGEVYNFQEMRKELLARGYAFSSSTDSEVVLNAVHCWGIEKALSLFIGMYAFALWDVRKRVLYLARDRAGIKPLYYHLTNRRLLFASEMKGLLAHPAFPKDLQATGVAQFFVLGYFPGRSTVFKDTHKVLPGHYMTVTDAGVVTGHRYWSLDAVKRDDFRGSFEDAVAGLEELCESAFRYRLIADVPVGMFLSGGIDSSFVSAFLKKRLNVDLLQVTIGFNDALYDETAKARAVAEQLGLRHIVHRLDVQEAQDALLRFTEVYDEPFGDTSGIPTSLLSRIVREHVKVALSADGGDEQFCGYESYASYSRQYARLRRVPFIIRSIGRTLLQRAIPYRVALSWVLSRRRTAHRRPQVIGRYEKMTDGLKVRTAGDLIKLMNEKAWTEETVAEILRSAVRDVLRGTVLSDIAHDVEGDELIDLMMRTDYSAFLADDILTKVDRASMAVSLECRDPLLDHRIAEYAYSLPVRYLYENGEHKRVVKHMLRRWVDPSTVDAPKQGFVIPLYEWLRGPWKPIVHEYLSRDRIRAVGVLDEKAVDAEVDRFYRYGGCRGEKIFVMLNFQMWAERWYLA